MLNAAKRVSKKRGTSSDEAPISPQKRRKTSTSISASTPFEIESSLRLPVSPASESELQDMTIITNRAPLVLAFAVCVLKYTMPEQPISSRLSLAQAVVSANSRSKAISVGIESGPSAEQEGYGKGHPIINVLGREIRVLKRWDYNPHEGRPLPISDSKPPRSNDVDNDDFLGNCSSGNETDRMPPLWGVDLEAVRSSDRNATGSRSNVAGALPIFTAESARDYLFRSILKPQGSNPSLKSKSNAVVEKEKEECVGCLIRTIDLVCQSWNSTLNTNELDKRAWAWYVRVRPDVQSGAQGWGGKGEVKLSDIMNLRRDV